MEITNLHSKKKRKLSMSNFEIFICDTETTGFDPEKNDVIEISLLRLSDEEQRTWFLKPQSPETIEESALKVNGACMDDLLWKTAAGRNKYRLVDDVLPEIENWVADSGVELYNRIICGHNINFDVNMLKGLWKKNGNEDTFPFCFHSIDTKGLAMFVDFALGKKSEKYSLAGCVKTYGIPKKKFHGAEADVQMTKDLFLELKKFIKQ